MKSDVTESGQTGRSYFSPVLSKEKINRETGVNYIVYIPSTSF